MGLEDLLQRYKVPLAAVLIGLIFVGLGIFLSGNQESPKVEILTETPPKAGPASSMISIDIEGAVQAPGVYQLDDGARVNDLLIKAGGLSADADRDWVNKNINLAQKLTDGNKVYIPQKGELESAKTNLIISEQTTGITANSSQKININTATASELDGLWGIGEKRAADIINNRPYQTTEELVSRKVIPQSIFEKIKNNITIY